MAIRIGVFDSGLGGLSLLKNLKDLLPFDFIYLGDTARLPYGTKSPETILSYLQQNIAFLSKHNVDAIVVACNSASTVLDRNIQSSIPVWGVIEAGSAMAVQTSKNQHIAVIGTRATIASESYNKAIKKLSKDAIVWSQACPLFVPLVEENYHSGPVVQQVIADYLSEIKKTDCDTLILGCTHYPLLKKEIQNYLGQNIQLVDSTQILSKQMAKHFSVSENSQKGKVVESYLTDTSPAFIKIASSILGETLDWKLIDIR